MTASFDWFSGLPDLLPRSRDEMSEYGKEKETWQSLVNEITGEFGREHVTLNVLLQGLDLRSKAPKVPKDAVRCNTIHSSKGMEFDHVYLVGLVEDQLPSWAAKKKGH